MRAGTMNFMRDIVAGSMGKPLGESGGADHVASGIVGLESADGTTGGEGLFDRADGGIASIAHRFKDLLLALGGFAPDYAGPRDVVKDRSGIIHAAPYVDEQKVAFLDLRSALGCWLVVRVGAVSIHADVGPVLPNKVGTPQTLAQPLHHVELGDLAVFAFGRTQTPADLLPALFEEIVDGNLCDGVAENLLLGKNGLKLADEVGGTDDLLADAAEELYGASIDHGDVHNVVVGRILHGDPMKSVEHGLKTRGQFLPTGINAFRSRQRVKAALFNPVNQFARFAKAGDEVIPAPRDVRLRVEAENPFADRIAVMMIVKEPAIVARIAQRSLDRFQVHRRNSTATGLTDGFRAANKVNGDSSASTNVFWVARNGEGRSTVNNQVIQGRYFADLVNQPVALEATWKNLDRADFFEHLAKACGRDRYQRIILTGMGGSYFGLHPLCLELAANGWTPLMLETSELIHYCSHLLDPTTLVVAVSQSGKSAEMVRLLEMNARRATVIGVTNWADSPLARDADFTVLTAAGDEYTVSCKTYVTTQLALKTLGAVLCGGDATERLQEMKAAPTLVGAYLNSWESHVAELVELLRDVGDVFLVGRGPSLAAASTGALTIKESTHFHAEGMSCAALRHGPFEMLRAGIFVGVFAGEQKTRALNEGLVRDVEGTPARAVMFSPDAERPSCRFPQAAEALRPIVEILPVQMMTLALAALADREAGKFERATKVTVVE